MHTFSTPQPTDLICVAEAAKRVPYSRDHITRLARESKIIATQINRRWLVSAISLQRFYDSCRHEDKIRQQYLSEARRRDLEINEQLQRQRDHLAQSQASNVGSVWYSATVVLGGLFCGVFLYTALPTQLTTGPQVAQVSQPTTPVASTRLAETGSAAALSSAGRDADRVPSSVTRELSLADGIVLLPASATSSGLTEDFFSDEVTIEMIDDTRGVIRLSGSPDAPELTVVRVPDVYATEVTPRGP